MRAWSAVEPRHPDYFNEASRKKIQILVDCLQIKRGKYFPFHSNVRYRFIAWKLPPKPSQDKITLMYPDWSASSPSLSILFPERRDQLTFLFIVTWLYMKIILTQILT
ncbi:hypothetical protein AVEN_81617-1 [Araneus ventricosus]|uniref:Uncharacterized protein n=1 Tax=Araneus ventricosus TaxID=182803 RepID=A0A4Y2J4F6_ARAVE|nr:hypothetical protein AVEN_192616-1 [Araneus ventricosus]GBM85141.1 hypothetical protein AVEN_81617-1 [Araneus ventricosus]